MINTVRFPRAIQDLIDDFNNLPTVGPKTAERYVFYLLKQPKEKISKMANDLLNLKENIKVCQTCLNISENDPCEICSNKNRDESLLCLVSTQPEMIAIESTKKYNGLYYILGRNMVPQEGLDINKTIIRKLENKVKNGQFKEIILALSPTIEGETTSMYLTKLLRPYKAKITKLARGLAMGSDIEYADEITLNNALKNRNEM